MMSDVFTPMKTELPSVVYNHQGFKCGYNLDNHIFENCHLNEALNPKILILVEKKEGPIVNKI
jgi:hypothetical protein